MDSPAVHSCVQSRRDSGEGGAAAGLQCIQRQVCELVSYKTCGVWLRSLMLICGQDLWTGTRQGCAAVDSSVVLACPGESPAASAGWARGRLVNADWGVGPSLPPGSLWSYGLGGGGSLRGCDPVTRRESGRRVIERSPEVSRETRCSRFEFLEEASRERTA